MNASLYQAASALDANRRWQEVISQNLAASSIPGYKKQELTFEAVQAGLERGRVGEAARPAGSYPVVRTTTDFSPGQIRPTGAATDLAISGPAFFEVQLPNGSTAYTRDGEFHLDSSGQLVTKEGYLVMSSNGTVQMDPRNAAPLTVSAQGELAQGADQKGQLRLVEFRDPKQLTQISGGYFLATDPTNPALPAAESTVRQGYLEGANTSPVMEMVNLMTAMRSFEANQKVIQANDERMSRFIREIGEPS